MVSKEKFEEQWNNPRWGKSKHSLRRIVLGKTSQVIASDYEFAGTKDGMCVDIYFRKYLISRLSLQLIERVE